MRGRVVLPLGLFVLLVAGITWVSQYLPSWKAKSTLIPPPAKEAPLRFTGVSTVERNQMPGYIEEHERGVEGHHDFLFENTSAKAATLGLLWKKCNCSRLEICLLKAEEAQPLLAQERQKKLAEARTNLIQLAARLAGRWQPLSMDDPKGQEIPAQSCGLLRLIWRGRDSDEEHVELVAQLWIQPADGTMKDRTYIDMKPVIALVSPVRLAPDKQDVGVLLPGANATRKFLFWSATRDDFDLKVVSAPDPCLTWQVKRLGADECPKATENLRKAHYNTRVRSAYRLTCTLFEEKDGKQLDMGVVLRPIAVKVQAGGQTLDVPNPLLYGRVRSDIELVGGDKQGKVNLQTFQERDGTSQTVRLVARAGVKLKVEAKPAFLDVILKAPKAGEGQATWEMEVTALPGQVEGEIPSDTVVVLRADAPGAAARLLRIGVVGTAIHGATGAEARD